MRKLLAMVIAALAILVFLFSFSFRNEGKKAAEVIIRGSGSTFLQPQLEAWIQGFLKDFKNVSIEYQGVGSGAGQEQFFKRLTDFCGSDPPLSRQTWERYRGKVLQLPIILGAVAVVYNVPELKDRCLKLDGRVLALIYLGRIEYWDDPMMRELNPGLDLPHRRITAVHRSDASGTTQIFTTFLHEAAPDLWPSDLVGKTVNWPVDGKGRGVGGKGNPGVVAALKSTEYSVGYVELEYAYREALPVAAIKNRDGNFVLPSVEAIQEAAKNALPDLPEDPSEDFSSELQAIVYAPGNGSYSITAFSHVFIRTTYSKEKTWVVREFIRWICERGSGYVVEGYVPVPEEIRNIDLRALDLVRSG